MFTTETTNTLRVLIIDDAHQDTINEIRHSLKQSYPHAEIECAKGFEDIRTKVPTGKYNLVLLDAILNNWIRDDEFEIYGWNVLPFVQTHLQGTKVFAISSDPEHNQKMVTLGADKGIEKLLFGIEPAHMLFQ